MKNTSKCLAALALIVTPASATTLIDVDFSTIPDGDITIGTPIGGGTWEGGPAPVSGGLVNTITSDGYVNFNSSGFAIDLNSNLTYNFEASINVNGTTGTRGLFGQLQSFNTGASGFWMRLQGDNNEIRFNLRDSDGAEKFRTFDASAALASNELHSVLFSINAANDTASVFIDGNQIGASWDLTTDGLEGVIGESDKRFVVGAYNTTAANRFDGIASSYTVSAVPEPSSTALLGLGGLALILRRRK